MLTIGLTTGFTSGFLWLALAAAPGPVPPQVVPVKTIAELRTALAAAKPGQSIEIARGSYRGFDATNLNGTAERPITIRAADPKDPPVFTSGVHFAEVTYLTLEDLIIRGAPANGLNIDDGGTFDTPSHHVTLRRIAVESCGGRGNDDGIKLSGLNDFVVEGCTIERWGRGGSAIDMVGCRRGRIEQTTIRDLPDEPASDGVQAKGGSREITIRGCRFEHAGQRAVNIGGSTGLQFFRPKPEGYEAKEITVEECTFVGSLAPIAFVGVDGATVRRNTFYRPTKWFMRILQETTADGFVPCRNGRFAENLIVYRQSEVRTPVNVGPGTSPESFTFEGNYWFATDAPERSRPTLPTEERNPAGGKDPMFVDAEHGNFTLREGSPAKGHGAKPIGR